MASIDCYVKTVIFLPPDSLRPQKHVITVCKHQNWSIILVALYYSDGPLQCNYYKYRLIIIIVLTFSLGLGLYVTVLLSINCH